MFIGTGNTTFGLTDGNYLQMNQEDIVDLKVSSLKRKIRDILFENNLFDPKNQKIEILITGKKIRGSKRVATLDLYHELPLINITSKWQSEEPIKSVISTSKFTPQWVSHTLAASQTNLNLGKGDVTFRLEGTSIHMDSKELNDLGVRQLQEKITSILIENNLLNPETSGIDILVEGRIVEAHESVAALRLMHAKPLILIKPKLQ